LNDVNTPSSQDHIPAELKHIIRALLSLNPEARPSCDEILEKIGHLKPKAPNMQNSTPDVRADHQTFMSRMRFGNPLGIHSNLPTAHPFNKSNFTNGSKTQTNPPNMLSGESSNQGIKIERIPSDMGYAGKVVADSDVDEVEEDAIMGEWLDDDQSDISGARKRRRGSETSWNVGEGSSTYSPNSDPISDSIPKEKFANENEQLKHLLLESPDLPGDAHQQSQLSIRILALVPDSHREMAEFWMRTATEVDWIKLLKAVSAILKVM
jgi:hypothetical protein